MEEANASLIKLCSKCKISKLILQFYNDKRKKDCKRSQCAKCNAEYKRNYIQKIKDDSKQEKVCKCARECSFERSCFCTDKTSQYYKDLY